MKIKTKGVLTNILWSFIQRGGSLIISFVANMVLARLLSPDDFGCIGLILVFVSFADVLVDGGLGNALIQKTNLDNKDTSTVFTTNFAISLFLFIIVFFAAPFIENYFQVNHLALYLRVESIAILIRAFYVVQHSMLAKNLRFKSIATVSITSSILSATVGIVMAANGFGVWSLIAKNITQHFATSVLYRINSHIPFRFGFDKKAFTQLFGFGWFVALTGFMDLLYSNLVSFIVGKRYSVKDLGYYNQANSLQQIPTYSLSMVINQVLFPYMARIHEDKALVKAYARRVTVVSTFVIFPLMIYMICFARPIIVLLYSSKWLMSAIYFQILCIEGVFHSMLHINRCILKSIGETKVLFNIQLIVLVIGIVMLLIAKQFDIKILVCSLVINTVINWLILAIIAGNKIGYSLFLQIKDVLPSFFICGFAISCSWLLIKVFEVGTILSLLISAFSFIAFYFGLHFLFKTKAFKMSYNVCFPNSKN